MKTIVLVVEDDSNIAMGLEEILRGEGFSVVTCRRGDQALAAAIREKPGLIVLDIMLPGASGFDVCKQLRKKQISTPILMLSAKSQEMDKVIGLDFGADDYVTKPFSVRELIARIHALLRRTASKISSDKTAPSFRIGEYRVDPATFQVQKGKAIEQLTARELKLLEFFHAHADEVLSRDRLLNEVWGQNYYGTTRTLDQVIVQLRKKLGDSAETPSHLLTVHGVGYKLVL